MIHFEKLSFCSGSKLEQRKEKRVENLECFEATINKKHVIH